MNLFKRIEILSKTSFIAIIFVSMVLCANDKFDDVFKGAEDVKCNNKTEQKVDHLMTLLIPGGTDERIPETPTQLRKYCNRYTKTFPFVLGVFKHCTSPFVKTFGKFIFYPIRKQMDATCKTGKISRHAKMLMSLGKCGNLANLPIRDCNNNFIDGLNGVSFAPPRSRINMLCCHSHSLFRCLREGTEETVGCTRSTIDLSEKFIFNLVGGIINVACGEYFQESDKCTKMIRETPKSVYKSGSRPKSIITPLIKLMESLPDLDDVESR